MREKLFSRSLEQHRVNDIKYHLFHDPHKRASRLSDIILGGLRQMKLVVARREGKEVYYRIEDDHIISLFGEGVKHVRLCNIMALALCICSLSIHFAADSSSATNSSGSYELATEGGQSQDPLEHPEDDFVLSAQNSTYFSNLFSSSFLAAEIFSFLPVFLPLLPPPKFNTTA